MSDDLTATITSLGPEISHHFEDEAGTVLFTYAEPDSGAITAVQVVAPLHNGAVRTKRPGFISEPVVTVQIDEGDT